MGGIFSSPVLDKLPQWAQANPRMSTEELTLLETSSEFVMKGKEQVLHGSGGRDTPFAHMHRLVFQKLRGRRRPVANRNMTCSEILTRDGGSPADAEVRFLADLLERVVGLASVAMQAAELDREPLLALRRYISSIEDFARSRPLSAEHYCDICEAVVVELPLVDTKMTQAVREVWIKAFSGFLIISIPVAIGPVSASGLENVDTDRMSSVSSPLQAPKKRKLIGQANWDFHPSNSSQIELRKGDFFAILKMKESGWSLARPLRRNADGSKAKKGWVPSSYLELVDPHQLKSHREKRHGHIRHGSNGSEVSVMSSMSSFSMTSSALGTPPLPPSSSVE